jgi:hypothetical protein
MIERKRFLINKMDTPLGTAVLIADEAGALRLHAWEDPTGRWRKEFHRRHRDAELVSQCDPFGHVAALELLRR